MKRISLFLLITLVAVLSACEAGTSGNGGVKNCIPGWELVDGECEEIVVECGPGEVLIGDTCMDESDPNAVWSGPAYTSQGYDEYEGRDIVDDSCSHLDNIGEWQPVWCDEFDYQGLPNSDLWSYDVGGHGWGNGELQYYTDGDLDNAFVQDGILTIRSIKEYVGGKNYTSTRLISKNTGDFLYGKIQVRAKVPAGRGTWPAIWMLPTDWEYGGWPTSGEIDIMEYVGYQPNVIHATIHTGAFNHSLNTQIGKARSLSTAEEEFHVYEIEWEPNVIRYYLNGVQFFEVSYDPDTMSDVLPYEAWPFDKDFHLLINTAIGGAWGGVQGVDDEIFPVDFQIDYVRVYQKDYSGMDTEAPSAPSNLRAVSIKQSSVFLGWDIAVDDVMTKEYKVYQDDVLLDTVTHNGHLVDGLNSNTQYTFKVVPIDFAGNEGAPATLIVTTSGPLSTDDRIEAEDFTAMSGIQVENTTDAGGGMNIGYIDDGDYMEYEVIVTQSGNYQLKARVASQSNGGMFDILQDGVKIGDATFNATGGWQTWADGYSSIMYLEAGTYTFRIEAKSSGFNVNYFEFVEVN